MTLPRAVPPQKPDRAAAFQDRCDNLKRGGKYPPVDEKILLVLVPFDSRRSQTIGVRNGWKIGGNGAGKGRIAGQIPVPTRHCACVSPVLASGFG
ncbi:hypothetical protein IT775_12005 [Thalassobius aquimarinus]|uniref:Uncharacterized protein n=1 Tax=Thalassovita aquimarina TaxID=2785917 RepID=A0ABS5HS86_9RHOB|nr:hypothetical protein [Thalassovita aquimarina]